jgi:hypothetical protein
MFECGVAAHLKAASAFPALPGTFRSRTARSSSRPSLSLILSCTEAISTPLSCTYMTKTLPWRPLEALQVMLHNGAYALLLCKCPKQENILWLTRQDVPLNCAIRSYQQACNRHLCSGFPFGSKRHLAQVEVGECFSVLPALVQDHGSVEQHLAVLVLLIRRHLLLQSIAHMSHALMDASASAALARTPRCLISAFALACWPRCAQRRMGSRAMPAGPYASSALTELTSTSWGRCTMRDEGGTLPADPRTSSMLRPRCRGCH